MRCAWSCRSAAMRRPQALDAACSIPRARSRSTTLLDLGRHRTLMTTPVTRSRNATPRTRCSRADGVAVDVIRDSPGFVAQRVLAHIVNVACDIAQQRIASPADIDLAVTLGLGYPQGPLAWGDALGPARILAHPAGAVTRPTAIRAIGPAYGCRVARDSASRCSCPN